MGPGTAPHSNAGGMSEKYQAGDRVVVLDAAQVEAARSLLAALVGVPVPGATKLEAHHVRVIRMAMSDHCENLRRYFERVYLSGKEKEDAFDDWTDAATALRKFEECHGK
jgi:hypothetical protein